MVHGKGLEQGTGRSGLLLPTSACRKLEKQKGCLNLPAVLGGLEAGDAG